MFPDLWDDDQILRDSLRRLGPRVDAVRWDDPSVDWAGYDLAVLRSPWDYPDRRDAFVEWAWRVPRLANPADIVEWNTDKRYLHELAAAGVPVTPTDFVAPGERWAPPSSGEWVVKPTVSGGSRDTGRYLIPRDRDLAVAHVERLQRDGRTAMVQPYLAAVDTAGETALLYLPDAAGELTFSHAIRKGPMLTGPYAGDPDLSEAEKTTARTASPAELSAGAATLAAIPGGTRRLLYARVDVIPGPAGSPLLVELELTEPSLFLSDGAGSADRLAAAILSRL
jgi:hypothetical protein